MIKVIKYIAEGWRGILATALFVGGAELWHREELRIAGIRTTRIAEAITKENANG